MNAKLTAVPVEATEDVEPRVAEISADDGQVLARLPEGHVHGPLPGCRER